MPGDCGSTCPVEGGFYAYNPNIAGNSLLLAAHGILIPAVLYLGIRFRTPVFSAILATGLLLDVVGFVGRLLLSGAPESQAFFVLSLLGTILGPACVSGAIFSTLPHILGVYGDCMSPIRPFLAGLVFYSVVSLAGVIQLIGVVFLAYDLSAMGRLGGTRIVAGGLGIQLLALLAFSGLHFWFTISLSTRRSGLDQKHSAVYRSVRFKRFLFGMETASVVLLAYSAYRIIEMANGVNGSLFQSQAAYMIVIGVFPLISAILITVFHPGAAFGSAWRPTSPLLIKKRRTVPPPLRSPREQIEEKAHERYDPDIRSQLSPASQRQLSPTSQKPLSPSSQRPLRNSSPPEVPAGSPGLPSNPKPAHMSTSPLPSPTGTAKTVETNRTRFSFKPEQRAAAPKQMVEKDSIW